MSAHVRIFRGFFAKIPRRSRYNIAIFGGRNAAFTYSYKIALRLGRAGGSVLLEKYVINGGKKLGGEVVISGAKNAVAAILPAVILADEPCVIENIPNISDVNITLQIMSEMGANIRFLDKTTVEIDTRGLRDLPIPY